MVDTIDTHAGTRGNNGLVIYIPQPLRVDSKNPIAAGMGITITVDGDKMVIEPTLPPISPKTIDTEIPQKLQE